MDEKMMKAIFAMDFPVDPDRILWYAPIGWLKPAKRLVCDDINEQPGTWRSMTEPEAAEWDKFLLALQQSTTGC